MGLYTRITRDWLEHRFSKRSEAGVVLAHMPIYGLGESDCEENHLGRLARLCRILRSLDAIEFGSLLDVGGAEGYLSHLARSIYGAEVASTDLSHEACQRANELFGIPSAAVDCHKLPFADDAFDVVVCSEVIEHVEHPVETILELQRVAARAVILTTEEVHFDRDWIDGYLFRRPGWPHMERNLFHPDDLRQCFPGATVTPQCDQPPPKQPPPAAEARAWLLANTCTDEPAQGRVGIAVTDVRTAASRCPRRHTDTELLDLLLGATIAKASRWPAPAALDALLPRLRDPDTREPLRVHGDEIGAPGGPRFPLHAGIPDFVRLQRPAPSRVELELELGRRYPDRAAEVLALRDRLFLPDRWTQDFFDMRQREDRRGFWPNDQLRPRADGGEGFCWLSVGGDPWIVTPCLQRPIREVEIEMRVHARDNPVEAGTGQVFWKGPGDDTFVEQHSVKFVVPNDGKVHTHRVALADHPLLPDEVQWMRLDLIDGECEVDFLSLRLA